MLRVRTVPAGDPTDLLARLPGPGPLAWVRRGDGLVGWGKAATIIIPAGPDRFAAAERTLRALFDGADTEDHVGLPGCGPVAFGSFTFDAARSGSFLVIPRTVAGRRNGVASVTTVTADDPGNAATRKVASVPAAEPDRGGNSLTAAQWERAVAAVVKRIRAGRLRKVVLAPDLQVTTQAPINVPGALAALAARDPDCYVFACAGLIGATPELLIGQQGRQARGPAPAGRLHARPRPCGHVGRPPVPRGRGRAVRAGTGPARTVADAGPAYPAARPEAGSRGRRKLRAGDQVLRHRLVRR